MTAKISINFQLSIFNFQFFLRIFVVKMRRLKKNIYLGFCATSVAVLAVVRQCNPSVMGEVQTATRSETPVVSVKQEIPVHPVETKKIENVSYHPIRSVYSYDKCFPDVQDVQILAARKWGVRPVRDRRQAEQRKSELVYVGSNPYYVMDRGMSHSIPYLVPRAADLLQLIGRSYLDSLAVKGVPLHRLIITSVLRSENDVARLRKNNGNASEQSCHRFGTTFDIAYNRYQTVQPPGERRRVVQNDTLKWVLSEVLRDIREQGRCYIKYEVKQGCFHITTR